MSDWVLTDTVCCEQCWKRVRHPCVTNCGQLRDASECQELLQLPRTEEGWPIRKRTVLSDVADNGPLQEEEPVPEYLMHNFAPNFPKRT